MSDLAIEKLPFAGSARFVASQEANPLDRPFFGHTAIGSAIKTAVSENSLSNKAASRLAATGTIESVIINNCDKNDEGIDQICSLVNLSKDFLFTATYILDASSAAAFKLFSAVARKQADNPNYRCFIAYNSLSSSSTSQIKKLAELTHANISLAKHKNGFSRASQHQKLFILDRERAALGGDNIDNPEEADMLITVRGPIVRNLIREAMLTWQTCHDFQYAPGTNLQTFLQSMLLSPDKTTATKQDTAMLTLNKRATAKLRCPATPPA